MSDDERDPLVLSRMPEACARRHPEDAEDRGQVCVRPDGHGPIAVEYAVDRLYWALVFGAGYPGRTALAADLGRVLDEVGYRIVPKDQA